jgi:hypothetical protein
MRTEPLEGTALSMHARVRQAWLSLSSEDIGDVVCCGGLVVAAVVGATVVVRLFDTVVVPHL